MLAVGAATGNNALVSICRAETGSAGAETVTAGNCGSGGAGAALAEVSLAEATTAAGGAAVPPAISARDKGIGMRTVSPRVTAFPGLQPFAASS